MKVFNEEEMAERVTERVGQIYLTRPANSSSRYNLITKKRLHFYRIGINQSIDIIQGDRIYKYHF